MQYIKEGERKLPTSFEGYTMVGTPTLTCQADGTFDNSAPVCEPNYCSDPKGVYPNTVISSVPPYHYLDTINLAVSLKLKIYGHCSWVVRTLTTGAVAPRLKIACGWDFSNIPSVHSISRKWYLALFKPRRLKALRRRVATHLHHTVDWTRWIATTSPITFG